MKIKKLKAEDVNTEIKDITSQLSCAAKEFSTFCSWIFSTLIIMSCFYIWAELMNERHYIAAGIAFVIFLVAAFICRKDVIPKND